MVQAIDKKKARLNCIQHLLGQMPYEETEHQPIVLPERQRHDDYVRHPVAQETVRSRGLLKARPQSREIHAAVGARSRAAETMLVHASRCFVPARVG